jgi:pimeloyl-ACP methyl ester carboxylesterase
MVADTRSAVDMLANLDTVDSNRIYAGGYSLGGTVALYAAALDERIAGVASISGVTPMRRARPEVEGICAYSHLHGLIPRLGFFVGNENRIPCDFEEIIACIAPRPILIVGPRWDRFAVSEDVISCVENARRVYVLSGAAGQLEILTPDDYNRFSPQILKKTLDWCGNFVK